ncbi:hypothetical protein IEQ34_005757 [Dendrobium chrysotoxum]|uniref:F-box domain-containing protein n=1 Tax=Dendrobium chrysotoxum TaxID=161865 RepID=A0AAV7HC65_DENCH|nr:hypothetical protein IEQ34_005757 [Dendrobium chrysotoxum]
MVLHDPLRIVPKLPTDQSRMPPPSSSLRPKIHLGRLQPFIKCWKVPLLLSSVGHRKYSNNMAWNDLPIDLLRCISSQLSIVDLARLSVVCTRGI